MQGFPSYQTLAIPTGSLACDGCVTCVEERLRENPHVLGVHIDTKPEVAHVTVHEGMVTAEELAETVAAACGDRNVVPLPKPQVGLPASRALVASTSLKIAHLTHRSPRARRPGRDAPAGSPVSAPGRSIGFEYFDEIDPEEVARTAAQRALTSLRWVRHPTGE